jgi:hypothetical protein
VGYYANERAVNTSYVDRMHRKVGWIMVTDYYGVQIQDKVSGAFDKRWRSIEAKGIVLDEYLIEFLEELEESLTSKLTKMTGKWADAEYNVRRRTLSALKAFNTGVVTIKMAVDEATAEIKASFDNIHAYVSAYSLADENDIKHRCVFLELKLLEDAITGVIKALIEGWK